MIELFLMCVLVLGTSALCSGTEAALFSLPLVRARQFAEEGRPGARTLLVIREDLTRPIATLVVLNNIANIVGSIGVGQLATRALGSHLLGVFSAILTLLIIMFGEIIPKTLGERHNERWSLLISRPLMLVIYVLSPVVWIIGRLTPRSKPGPTTNEAEIRMLARVARQEGVIQGEESEMIQRVFALNDRTAQEIMTPRVNLTWLYGDETLNQVKDEVLGSQHTRMVVVGESVDEVLGIVLKSELLGALVRGEGDRLVQAFARPPRFVLQDARADKLLQTFQRNREHLMVVADDFGGVAGVVSLEDVLEVLTGEIVDETDIVVDLAEEAREMQREMQQSRLIEPI